YPNLSNKTIKELKENKDLFYVVMNTDQEQFVKQNDLFNKSYIRIDPFLGNHGFSIDYLNKEHVNKYHGVLLHVNENLSDHEFKIVQDIMNICEQKKLVLNIGGSCVLEDSRLNGCTELRAIMSFLLPRNATNVDETSIVLTTQVLQKQIITKPISIGYKSNRVVIEKGTIITISLGYGEFHLLRNLYQNKVKINILGNEYYIPCEPCMNTSWLYSPNKIYDISSRLTILSTKDFYRISSILDIDIDEILTAFKGIEVRIV
ncbi:hypothetical protein MX569_07850, partial [Anoxybacillus kestanbolensis]|uniref:hypothetical protein n=1 Tax=Anoxybacillus kestanbolensis TaxID=227476 RepID=UPI00208DD608